ncbi:MAG: efflux RND transporter periplasmic adaptor subunit [Bacteroidales bacterium]|nr:efflux RND transporter periplasmic adaptor subunit [Bacteroidales bacterium]
MKKIVLSIVAVLATLLAVGCSSNKNGSQPLPIVRLSTVQMVSGMRHNSYPGTTQAAQESQVAFKVAGTLERIAVKEGDHVRQGQVLAVMDSRDYVVQLNAVKAEYESVSRECERIIALYNDRGTSANNYDKARFGLEQITQKLQHAQDQVNDCVIRAPFDGYVQSIYRKAHETVGAGMPVVGLFGSKGIEVVINIPVVEYNRQQEFENFTASFSVPDETLPLKLISIGQKANANQLYEMRLLLPDAPKEITPGLTTHVNIRYKEQGNIPMEVPRTAVFEEDEKTFVYVYADSTLHKTEVRVNFLTSQGTVHVVKGLEAGQRVVSAGVHSLNDGQKVRPEAPRTKTNVGGLL